MGGSVMFDAELSTIKTLSLETYAKTHGFERDAQESSQRVTVLRRKGDNGKLLAQQSRDGHWVYRDERDTRNKGTILDFAMHELRANLGEARKALRAWANLPSHPAQTLTGQTGHSENVRSDDEPDRARMLAIWNAATWVPEHPYLLTRKIPATVLNDARFSHRWKLDRHGNAVFPSWDKQGICGLEFRSETKKHFAKGGKKGLWVSANIKDCKRMVVCEAPIDALSHFALYVDRTDLDAPLGYACPGGSLGERSKALLVHLFTEAGKRGADILIGTDNDPAGHEYAEMIAKLSPVVVERIAPISGDWNDDLCWCVRELGELWN